MVSSPPRSSERGSAADADPADASGSSGSSLASADNDDVDEQLVASALRFVENLLVVGGFAVATNKQSGLLHVLKQDSGRLLCRRMLSTGFSVSDRLDAGAKQFCRTCKTCALASS